MMKLLNLLGLLAPVAWLARHPDWEPALTSIGLFASLIALKVSDKKKNSKELLNDLRDRLNEMGTFAYQAHQDPVKMGRKLLG
jgi:hypothetical protein